ncbi:MAG: hypothetical protein JNL62_19060 [Bryobacterales bacterium]|nr:hypothetical protein [Bryobacterales bacterium]
MPEGQRTAENPANVLLTTDPSQSFGNAGRNLVRGPSYAQMNFGLRKDFSIPEHKRVEFRMDSPNSNRSSAAFGTIIAVAQPAREIQFALRFAF